MQQTRARGDALCTVVLGGVAYLTCTSDGRVLAQHSSVDAVMLLLVLVYCAHTHRAYSARRANAASRLQRWWRAAAPSAKARRANCAVWVQRWWRAVAPHRRIECDALVHAFLRRMVQHNACSKLQARVRRALHAAGAFAPDSEPPSAAARHQGARRRVHVAAAGGPVE